MQDISTRPPRFAGTWYPAHPDKLAALVDGYLTSAAEFSFAGRLLALIVPHAGYAFSGVTAGHAFRCLKGRTYPLVAVLSPFHSYHPDLLLTSAHDDYGTPLGGIAVDKGALDDFERRLRQTSDFRVKPIPKDIEHAIEIELPFLQRALDGDFSILPLMFSGGEEQIALAVGNALAETISAASGLLIASSDLSHYRSRTRAQEMDACMIQAVLALSPKAVFDVQASGAGYACGLLPVAAVVAGALALGADSACLLHYATSADQGGDPGSVVGYAALAIYRKAA